MRAGTFQPKPSCVPIAKHQGDRWEIFPFHPDVLKAWRQGLIRSTLVPVFPPRHIGSSIFKISTKFGQCSPLIPHPVLCFEGAGRGESGPGWTERLLSTPGSPGGAVTRPCLLSRPCVSKSPIGLNPIRSLGRRLKLSLFYRTGIWQDNDKVLTHSIRKKTFV